MFIHFSFLFFFSMEHYSFRAHGTTYNHICAPYIRTYDHTHMCTGICVYLIHEEKKKYIILYIPIYNYTLYIIYKIANIYSISIEKYDFF